jgi:methylenetetrahydrofolate reductase (NADPH)
MPEEKAFPYLPVKKCLQVILHEKNEGMIFAEKQKLFIQKYMKVIDHIRKADKTLFSFELLPPLKGHNIEAIYNTMDPLMEFNPLKVNITYHQEEIVYKQHPSGLLEKKTIRKRPGTVAISAAIKYKYQDRIHVVPHIICGGFTREETEYALIDLHFLGMHNLLVVRGDAPKNQGRFIPEPKGHAHSIDLIRQIMDINKGIYLDQEMENTTQTDFSIGVAGYPEKHFEAPNMQSDLEYLKQKIDAGADYIVTQMFFDNEKYFSFVKACREKGISVPIIPGLKPITRISELELLPQVFHIDIPEALSKELLRCKNNKEAYQLGIEWTIAQSKELMKFGVPVLHYFTIGIAGNIQQIAKAVF